MKAKVEECVPLGVRLGFGVRMSAGDMGGLLGGEWARRAELDESSVDSRVSVEGEADRALGGGAPGVRALLGCRYVLLLLARSSPSPSPRCEEVVAPLNFHLTRNLALTSGTAPSKRRGRQQRTRGFGGPTERAGAHLEQARAPLQSPQTSSSAPYRACRPTPS